MINDHRSEFVQSSSDEFSISANLALLT